MNDASEYKLTEPNLRQFIAASDSLVALRRPDPAVRAMFDKDVNDAGITTDAQTRDLGAAFGVRVEGTAAGIT